jgi:NitT/TauT family transport system ATP-binding protein
LQQPPQQEAELPESPALSFDGVGFAYETDQPVLADFSWQVRRGEFTAILGPSGSGKTTLLYLAAGIRLPGSGSVLLHGERVTRPHSRTGLMLQDYGLLPWYSARRNIEVGLAISGLPARERQERSAHWLERLGLAELGRKFPRQLSGGQRQRIALARLLALGPELLLLDEPLSAIDELTREKLQRELFGLSRETGSTTLLVTHNIEEAVLLADRILLVTQHAPIRSYELLETPFGGAMPRRSDPAFIAFCQQIRERMGL